MTKKNRRILRRINITFKFLKKAFSDMKNSAKAQHEVAKAMSKAEERISKAQGK